MSWSDVQVIDPALIALLAVLWISNLRVINNLCGFDSRRLHHIYPIYYQFLTRFAARPSPRSRRSLPALKIEAAHQPACASLTAMSNERLWY